MILMPVNNTGLPSLLGIVAQLTENTKSSKTIRGHSLSLSVHINGSSE